ncbi:FAD-dependent monooxygenase [Nonomuraea sp. B12E4]|uniref:FAD-dependent monooxygenase n=1 Tax=Nonomuraea sp. B12E4 TaxID=3153564 RepID=UPI00325CE499
MTANADVLIVGAGTTGLVLAIELARRGVIPRVIDAAGADHRESRAVSIVARSLELLDDLGLAQAAIERGVPLHALAFYQGATTLAEMDVTAVDSRSRWICASRSGRPSPCCASAPRSWGSPSNGRPAWWGCGRGSTASAWTSSATAAA